MYKRQISNWARTGFESQHNLGYWRNIDWAGIGPGAHSHYNAVNRISKQSMDEDASLTNPNEFYNLRAWDILHPKRWAQAINAGNVPWQNYECINAEDALIEEVMLGLRISQGLNVDELCAKMRKDNRVFDDSHLQKVILEVCNEDLAVLRENRIIATRKGRLLNDLLIERIVDACEEGLTVLK